MPSTMCTDSKWCENAIDSTKINSLPTDGGSHQNTYLFFFSFCLFVSLPLALPLSICLYAYLNAYKTNHQREMSKNTKNFRTDCISLLDIICLIFLISFGFSFGLIEFCGWIVFSHKRAFAPCSLDWYLEQIIEWNSSNWWSFICCEIHS